jgi:type II secretory pathway pseudopilin PulG
MTAATRTDNQQGIALIEVVVAVLLFAVAVVTLLGIQVQLIRGFNLAGDSHTAAWLAELKMEELLSQNLPDPNDEETWELTGGGDFSEFDAWSNSVHESIREDWQWRSSFANFEYRYRKELVFVGPEFIGSRYELEGWEDPTDRYSSDIPVNNPLEQPAARIVRVTLIVYLPEGYAPRGDQTGGDQSRYQMIDGRPAIRMVTYVDPGVLMDAISEEAESDRSGRE